MDPARTFLRPAVNGALGSVGEIVASPLAKSLVRYWWLALPIGFLGYHSWQKNKNKPTSEALSTTVTEIAPVVATVATLVMLNHLLGQKAAMDAQPVVKPVAYAVQPAARPAAAPALPAPVAPTDDTVLSPE